MKGRIFQLLLSNKLETSEKKITATVILGTELPNLSQNVF